MSKKKLNQIVWGIYNAGSTAQKFRTKTDGNCTLRGGGMGVENVEDYESWKLRK